MKCVLFSFFYHSFRSVHGWHPSYYSDKKINTLQSKKYSVKNHCMMVTFVSQGKKNNFLRKRVEII